MTNALAAVVTAATLALSPTSGVRATIQRQADAFRSSNWAALWATYSPRFRRTCDRGKWTAFVRDARSSFAPDMKLRIIVSRVQVHGSSAGATYRWLVGDKTIAYATGDHYVLIAGRWYDELDHVTRCS